MLQSKLLHKYCANANTDPQQIMRRAQKGGRVSNLSINKKTLRHSSLVLSFDSDQGTQSTYRFHKLPSNLEPLVRKSQLLSSTPYNDED